MSRVTVLRRTADPASVRAVGAVCMTSFMVRSSLLVPFKGFLAGLALRGTTWKAVGAAGDHRCGFVSCTRVLFVGGKGLFSKLEAITLEAECRARMSDPLGMSTLELNLLEDPTAGLATGPVEELTPTELETRVRVLVSGYTPSLYRLLYMPFVDVVALLLKEGLVPTADSEIVQSSSQSDISSSSSSSSGDAVATTGSVCPGTVSTNLRLVRPEEIMARWFTDGPSTLKQPHATAEAMGKRRWNTFCRALEAHWAAFEDVMPLTRVVQRHNLREELYIPLFRQLAMELVDPTKRASAVATLPGVILSLANGRAPRSMGLPENDTERVRLVSNLFLGVAQETGNTDLSYLAVQLLRANNLLTPFSAQKQITNVFAAAYRIETDWQMRATSLLIESYPKWLEYYKRVQLDNKAALDALERRSAATASDEFVGAETGEVTAAASRAPKKAPLLASKHRSRRSKGRTPESSKSTEAADSSPEDTGEGSREQYRYFTSRQQDDVTRVTALEENIEAALRSRASELHEVQKDRRRKKSMETAASSATTKLDCGNSSATPASLSASRPSPSGPARGVSRAARRR